MNVLAGLQRWYEAQCDGDWEHGFGVKIDTLDNPGWRVVIELTDTNLAEKSFQEVSNLEPESDWIRCWIEDKKFNGAGGPQKLEEIIKVFLQWAKDVS